MRRDFVYAWEHHNGPFDAWELDNHRSSRMKVPPHAAPVWDIRCFVGVGVSFGVSGRSGRRSSSSLAIDSHPFAELDPYLPLESAI